MFTLPVRMIQGKKIANERFPNKWYLDYGDVDLTERIYNLLRIDKILVCLQKGHDSASRCQLIWHSQTVKRLTVKILVEKI